MQFWIGYPSVGRRQMLFATNGGRPHEVPHAVVHTAHGGLFVREGNDPSTYFACDKCGATFRLRIEDGCNPSEAEVVEALVGLSPAEVVSSAALHHDDDEASDRKAINSYSRGETRDRAAQRSRALELALREIEELEVPDGQEVTGGATMAEA